MYIVYLKMEQLILSLLLSLLHSCISNDMHIITDARIWQQLKD